MIVTQRDQKLGEHPLPRFETIFRTLAFVPDIQGWREELERSGESGGTGLDQYLPILQSLQKLGLYDCSILHLDCSIGFVPFCLSLSMASHVTAVGAEPQPQLLEARERYGLHHLEVLQQPVAAFLENEREKRRWDAVLCLSHFRPDAIDFRQLGMITATVLYLAADASYSAGAVSSFAEPGGFSQFRLLGLTSSADGLPMVLWELLRDA